MLTRRRFLAIIGATGALAATGGAIVALLPSEDADKKGPPALKVGDDACARCGMLIGDLRYAAGWRDDSGAAAVFDDIGCMVVEAREHPPASAAFWVHDFHTEAWIEAETASYTISTGIKSPMAYGIAAAATPDDARSVASDGEAHTWADLAATVKAKG